MADTYQLGAGLIQHLKAYIDDRLDGIGSALPTTGADGESVATQISGQEAFLDPFNVNLIPLSLPLPEAFSRVVAAMATHAADDHVIAWVASHSWEDFYRKLLAAAQTYPEFLDTAVNVQQRFGFTSSPSPDSPGVAVILAGDGYAPIGDWVGRYDQMYSAVLVMRFAAGSVPAEYLP